MKTVQYTTIGNGNGAWMYFLSAICGGGIGPIDKIIDEDKGVADL